MFRDRQTRRNVMSRPPLPPFTRETAAQKARMAEDAWNSRDPVRVSLAYTEDSRWRNRSEFFEGRDAIIEFLTRKWAKEHDYRLIKDLWAFDQNRIAVRFQYEWHDEAGQWHRSYGNEQWEFDEHGLMRRREASINDIAIKESERRFHWPAPGPRPADVAGVEQYFHSGDRVCLVGLVALGAARDTFADSVDDYFARWQAALAQLLWRSGLSKGQAQRRAEDALLTIQGALVLARARNDAGIFRRALTELTKRLLAP